MRVRHAALGLPALALIAPSAGVVVAVVTITVVGYLLGQIIFWVGVYRLAQLRYLTAVGPHGSVTPTSTPSTTSTEGEPPHVDEIG